MIAKAQGAGGIWQEMLSILAAIAGTTGNRTEIQIQFVLIASAIVTLNAPQLGFSYGFASRDAALQLFAFKCSDLGRR
jgi:hypothetical protein